jgi:hypothetical protein
MTSDVSEHDRIVWEAEHNQPVINIYDEILGMNISVDFGLLIEPLAYSSPDLNVRRRQMAIKQGVFKPHPSLLSK